MAMDYPDTVIKLVVLDIVPAVSVIARLLVERGSYVNLLDQFLMYDLGNSHWASWYWQ